MSANNDTIPIASALAATIARAVVRAPRVCRHIRRYGCGWSDRLQFDGCGPGRRGNGLPLHHLELGGGQQALPQQRGRLLDLLHQAEPRHLRI